MDLLKWIIFILVVLWIVWFLTGGPQSGRISQPFLSPPAPIGSGELYGEPLSVPGFEERGETGTASEENIVQSIFSGSVSLGIGNPYETSPQQEYVEIRASFSNTQPINITGWQLKSAITGVGASIGKGVYLPSSGVVNKEEQIFLNPGDRAILSTGQSPNGTSFRLNLCTGFFEQFQDFAPSLPQECPRVDVKTLPVIGSEGLNDACIDYLERLPQCFAHVLAIPVSLSSACSEYINKNIHYNGCVETHKNDQNFYTSEWRIFLKKNSELWRQSRETIKLLDAQGKVIDSLSY